LINIILPSTNFTRSSSCSHFICIEYRNEQGAGRIHDECNPNCFHDRGIAVVRRYGTPNRALSTAEHLSIEKDFKTEGSFPWRRSCTAVGYRSFNDSDCKVKIRTQHHDDGVLNFLLLNLLN